jgi:3-hydroxyacyl-CoA dehydrogenase
MQNKEIQTPVFNRVWTARGHWPSLSPFSPPKFTAKAVITLDNPPVNGLGYDLRCGIVAGIDKAAADPGGQAVVLIGSDRAFSGGADMREFGSPKAYAGTHAADRDPRRSSAVPSPWSPRSAACAWAAGWNWRWARTSAWPAPTPDRPARGEAGPAARCRRHAALPRLIGLEAALNMIVSGAPVPPPSSRARRCWTR